MDYRLPYYMAYPLPLQYDDERIERRDFEYMKSMYPMAVKKILPYVEEECDRMAYEGSVIYDEYPDQLQIRLMCNRIYDKVKKMKPYDDEEMEMQASRNDESCQSRILPTNVYDYHILERKTPFPGRKTQSFCYSSLENRPVHHLYIYGEFLDLLIE